MKSLNSADHSSGCLSLGGGFLENKHQGWKLDIDQMVKYEKQPEIKELLWSQVLPVPLKIAPFPISKKDN